jgi:hypothetical protein
MGPDRRCRACGRLALITARDCTRLHMFCTECKRCWQPGTHGYVRVEPLGCGGCSTQSRDVCIAMLSASFPRFGADTSL